MRGSLLGAIALAAALLWIAPARAGSPARVGLTCAPPPSSWSAAAGFAGASLACVRLARRFRPRAS